MATEKDASNAQDSLPPMTAAEVFQERVNRPGGLFQNDNMAPEDALREAQQLRAERLTKAAATEKLVQEREVKRRLDLLHQKLNALPSEETSITTIRNRRNIEHMIRFYTEGGKPPSISGPHSNGFFVQDGVFLSPDDMQKLTFDPKNPILWEAPYGDFQLSGRTVAGDAP
ncbi:hypothetical protein SPI_06857 [Niveomyces insectorum RCEF 264]|uniref:Uncharacterized protein n=1 Tax=Niveomyces insectorum RCEF 264 TaxID=1081102 RepID=A0A167QUA6_9HYPO|nr:hypothetical protein SPI_06857 [Niveomyces insectorum RCEF 264]